MVTMICVWTLVWWFPPPPHVLLLLRCRCFLRPIKDDNHPVTRVFFYVKGYFKTVSENCSHVEKDVCCEWNTTLPPHHSLNIYADAKMSHFVFTFLHAPELWCRLQLASLMHIIWECPWYASSDHFDFDNLSTNRDVRLLSKGVHVRLFLSYHVM